jgi:putative ABC transport system ATP-binding protein
LAVPSEPPLVEAKNVGRRHPDDRSWLLDDVSLRVECGARILLNGPSGAGKTLLLRSLALLDPLTCGSVYYQGEAVGHDAVASYRSRVVYLHQRPALIEDTVEAALRKPFTLKVHRNRAFERDRVRRLLACLGRDAGFLTKSVAELSGGEIQITAIVRALELDPLVLLLDELTAALDAPAAAAVERLVDGWLDEDSQRAMIWVSHNEAQALRVGRRAIRMVAGRLVEE